MSTAEWFRDLDDEFDESIRIDSDEETHREDSIESYHVTADSGRVIKEFIDRTLGEADDMRSGSNYWLYGYYGSGKSHLLTVLEGLVDTDWISGQLEAQWETLTANAAYEDIDSIEPKLRRLHADHQIIPISINLLKYQGRAEESFSQILLQHVFQSPALTGVDDDISQGLSADLDVAFFEQWYRTTDSWATRESAATEIVTERLDQAPASIIGESTVWSAIQEYPALAEVVLPELFERETGSRDGYQDLTPSDIDPETVIERINTLRKQREAALGESVKVVLLLDEVSLFIGDDDSKLTELQTIAEAIDEIDDANIQLVATAQETIEDSQPELTDQGNTGILKDRFPHRYQLPSKHVGDIARLRLLAKSQAGIEGVEETLADTAIEPANSLVYSDIGRNKQPPLDSINNDDLKAFYPFLPYQAPLFLDILSNLRREANDPAKSIFSGTARAILALMHRLLHEWIDEGESDHMISVIEFFDEIKPALRETLRNDMRVLEGINGNWEADGDNPVEPIAKEVKEGALTDFDYKVAKAVLLLQTVSDMVPMTERNIAVSVMDDLDGESLITTQNKVEESLDRLEKFIRPNETEGGPRYRFANYIERTIYEEAARKESTPQWDEIITTVDNHLFEDLIERLSLPDTVPFDGGGQQYPVNYNFIIDGTALATRKTADGSLEVTIALEGLRPDTAAGRYDDDPIEWTIDTEGIADLRETLVEWWALRAAIDDRNPPDAITADLTTRRDAVLRKLTSAMADGSYIVKDRTDITSRTDAVQTAIDVNYHKIFHPMLLQVTDDQAESLAAIDTDEPLPAWAQTIEVPPTDPNIEPSGSIQRNVLSLVGRQLKDQPDGLALSTILSEISDRIPFFEKATPAACAIIWGFCRRGRFRAVDEGGTTLADDVVLDPTRRQSVRLQLLTYDPPRKALEEAGYLETTETLNEGLQALQAANEDVIAGLDDLHENVELVRDKDITATPIIEMLEAFLTEIEATKTDAEDRLQTLKSQQGDIRETITATKAAEEWIEEATDTWSLRRKLLLRYDIQLTLADQNPDWLDDTAVSSLTAHKNGIAGYDGEWWTEIGWSNLVDQTEIQVTDQIESSWTTFVEARSLDATVETIRDHPLIQSRNELSSSVFDGFLKSYIRPLESVVRWYDNVEAILTALESEDDTTIANASETAAGLVSWETLTEFGEPADLLQRLPSAETVTDNESKVGVVPDDREAIDDLLKSLLEEKELEIETTATGVVIS